MKKLYTGGLKIPCMDFISSRSLRSFVKYSFTPHEDKIHTSALLFTHNNLDKCVKLNYGNFLHERHHLATRVQLPSVHEMGICSYLQWNKGDVDNYSHWHTRWNDFQYRILCKKIIWIYFVENCKFVIKVWSCKMGGMNPCEWYTCHCSSTFSIQVFKSECKQRYVRNVPLFCWNIEPVGERW